MKLFDLFKRKKPNIIMIFVDGAARQDALRLVPFYQNLKKISCTFSSMITYAPYSIASLNAIIPGMYGNLNGVDGYYKAYNFDKKNIFTLTQYLKEAGYHTETDLVISEGFPTQGFDKARVFGRDETKDEIDLTKRHSEILTQLRNKEPFFLFLDYNKIALNLVPTVIKKYNDFSEKYFKNKEKNFGRYLEWLKDSGIYLQSLLNHIKDIGLYDSSIIIIFFDHGCSVGDKMGEKVYGVYLYDYTIKCSAYFIGKNLPKGVEIKSVVRSIDLMPTILDILKIKQKRGYKPMQGESFLPLMYGKEGEERIAYSETGGLGGPTPSPEVHNVQSVRTNKWKLIYNMTNKKRELYDIINDREENNNLAGKGLEIEDGLWNEMQKINEEHSRINKRWADKR